MIVSLIKTKTCTDDVDNVRASIAIFFKTMKAIEKHCSLYSYCVKPCNLSFSQVLAEVTLYVIDP